jgi:hypothetical protein
MTMKEVEYRTPNGLLDSQLLGLSVNYQERVLRLDLNWLIGTPEGNTYEEREGYRTDTLTISGLRYCVVEAPLLGTGDSPDQIQGFETGLAEIERCQLPDVDGDTFRHSIHVGFWESFVHFAGISAELIPADLIVREMGQ